MSVKTPKQWDDEEFKQIHLMLDHPGWKLFQKYARMRMKRHREKIVDMIGVDDMKAKEYVGRIKETEDLLKPIYKRLEKASKKRTKENEEINQ